MQIHGPPVLVFLRSAEISLHPCAFDDHDDDDYDDDDYDDDDDPYPRSKRRFKTTTRFFARILTARNFKNTGDHQKFQE